MNSHSLIYNQANLTTVPFHIMIFLFVAFVPAFSIPKMLIPSLLLTVCWFFPSFRVHPESFFLWEVFSDFNVASLRAGPVSDAFSFALVSCKGSALHRRQRSDLLMLLRKCIWCSAALDLTFESDFGQV